LEKCSWSNFDGFLTEEIVVRGQSKEVMKFSEGAPGVEYGHTYWGLGTGGVVSPWCVNTERGRDLFAASRTSGDVAMYTELRRRVQATRSPRTGAL
jgi:hypothetical protein